MKSRSRGRGWAAGCLLASALSPAPALANGRFPAAQLVLTDPSDADRLWVRATFGVLTSSDRGCTWHWICEGALGYSGTDDPMLGVMANGTVIGGIFNGLVTSTNHGCDWNREGPLKGLNVVDLAVEKGAPWRAIAVSSLADATGNYDNKVWRTVDSGVSWSASATLSPDLVPLAIDTAPSNSQVIYVTALDFSRTDAGTVADRVLLRSTDDGATWQSFGLGASVTQGDPYLSAVNPNDPRKLYVRLHGPDSSEAVENSVLYSDDGGQHFRTIFSARADILGFALSPDGSRIALGLGDSRASRQRPVDPAVLGIYRASTSDHQFERRRVGQVGCLNWTDRGMYVCGDSFPASGGEAFELGLSLDEGVSALKLMGLSGVEGPLACPNESQARQGCNLEQEWARVCGSIGRCDATGALVEYQRGDVCGPGCLGAGGQAGSGTTLLAPDAGGIPAAAQDKLHIEDGCSFSPRAPLRTLAALALIGLAAFGVRARAARSARVRSRNES